MKLGLRKPSIIGTFNLVPFHKVISWESKERELNAVGWWSGIYQLQILSLHLGERCWLKTFLIPIILWASLPPRTWLDGSLLFSVFLHFISPDLLPPPQCSCLMPQCRRLSCFWGHHQKLLSHWVCRSMQKHYLWPLPLPSLSSFFPHCQAIVCSCYKLLPVAA